MRSGMSPVEFFMRCNRKPAQQDLLDRITELSPEDIDNCGQPLWVRKALHELAKRGGKTASVTATAIADQMQENHKQNMIPTFPVYRWTKETILIKQEKGMSYDLEPGELVLVDTASGEIKIDYSVLKPDHAIIGEIMNNSDIIGMMTDREFIEYVAQDKQRRL